MGEKYLVISDNHGNIHNMKRVFQKFEGRINGLIHCGDLEFGPDTLAEMVDCPVYLATGNCDHFFDQEPETLVSIGPHTALVTHGHRYDIGWTNELILYRAQEVGADLVFYGHTHRPAWFEFAKEGISCFNPGSIALPRQFEPYAPTFLQIDVADDGTIIPTWCYIGRLGKKLTAFEVGRTVI